MKLEVKVGDRVRIKKNGVIVTIQEIRTDSWGLAFWSDEIPKAWYEDNIGFTHKNWHFAMTEHIEIVSSAPEKVTYDGKGIRHVFI